MSHLKRIAQELVGIGRADLAREVALASLEFKQQTKLASESNLQDGFSKLCHHWNGELCEALAKKLGWKVASYGSGDFLVNDPMNKHNYLKGILSTKSLGAGAHRTIFNLEIVGEVNGQSVEGEIRVHSSGAAVNDVVWMLGDVHPAVTANTRQASAISLQRKVDEIASAITDLTADLKLDGPDPAKQRKLKSLQAEWERSIKMLEDAIELEINSVSYGEW